MGTETIALGDIPLRGTCPQGLLVMREVKTPSGHKSTHAEGMLTLMPPVRGC